MLDSISEECFLFNANLNANLKFFWTRKALRGHRLSGTSGTLTLEHLVCSSTWALGHLGHLGTWAFSRIGHIATLALGHSKHLGTQDTLFSRLVCDTLGYSNFQKESWKHVEEEEKANFSEVCPISRKTYNE